MKFRNKRLFYSLPNVQSNLLFLRNFPDLISVDIQSSIEKYKMIERYYYILSAQNVIDLPDPYFQ